MKNLNVILLQDVVIITMKTALKAGFMSIWNVLIAELRSLQLNQLNAFCGIVQIVHPKIWTNVERQKFLNFLHA